MEYYSESHGIKNTIVTTYEISVDMYNLLLSCCAKYYENLAWKYPEKCSDVQKCCGIDLDQFNLDLRYEIPLLYRDSLGDIAVPATRRYNCFGDKNQNEYNQYALLDLIEFIANNVRDVEKGEYHSYWGHYHFTLKDSRNVCIQFRNEINSIFKKTGLLYFFNTNLHVERVIENSPITPSLENTITTVKEIGIRELLEEAITLHSSPSPANIRNATEKLWDAFERLKTYYTKMNKRDSAEKIVSDMSNGQDVYITLFDNEFRILTEIGNKFRIRHHETDKVEISDIRYYDYFFNRCISLIAIAIQYLQ